MKNFLLIAVIALLQLGVTPTGAEVYKYQDKNGKWHFTDKPPKDKNASAVTTTASTQTVRADLGADLQQAFNPASKTDEASLSVVTVQTSTGSGSGFFVTADGYIVTNRHVVRPATTNQWKDTEDKLEDWEQRLADFKADIDRHVRDLRSSKLMPGHDRIRIPGEARVERIAERTAKGVPLSPALLDNLAKLGDRLGIAPIGKGG